MNSAQHTPVPADAPPTRDTVASGTVVAVLLADGWHRAVAGSFTIGPIGFGTDPEHTITGFSFEETDDASPYGPATLTGPLHSVLALRQVAPPSRQHAVRRRQGRLVVARQAPS